jgi:hypothetical protein
MNRAMLRALALSAFVALPAQQALAADPIRDIDKQPVAEGARGGATVEQVGRAILAAGAMRDWRMTPVEAGVIKGVYAQRDWSAEIRVEYDATAFSIRYVTSENLKYGTNKQGQPVIHGNYNRWVNNLRVDTLKLLPFVGCAN